MLMAINVSISNLMITRPLMKMAFSAARAKIAEIWDFCLSLITGPPTHSVGASIVLLTVRQSSSVVVVCRRL